VGTLDGVVELEGCNMILFNDIRLNQCFPMSRDDDDDDDDDADAENGESS
jgi:hypothetical protein